MKIFHAVKKLEVKVRVVFNILAVPFWMVDFPQWCDCKLDIVSGLIVLLRSKVLVEEVENNARLSRNCKTGRVVLVLETSNPTAEGPVEFLCR